MTNGQTSRALKSGIVHLGLGAFFRAHAAIYIKEVMQQSAGDSASATSGEWGIVGVSLRSPNVRDRLQAHNNHYTAIEVSADGWKPQTIDCLTDVLVAPEDPQKVLDQMTSEAVKIVSLTITEKGYCRGAGDTLDLNHPNIQHDLTHALPRSAIGFITRALQARRAQGLRPFTVLSLDNLNNNGHLTKQMVMAFAHKIDRDLATWIDAECRFPSTMVDRIVPATTAEMIARLKADSGIEDPAMVAHEPFRQWVIEDNFVDDIRPDFGAVGAELVKDVQAFEHMKLRMLNGTHSALAYMGSLAGYDTVSEAVKDPQIAEFLRAMWREEIIPALEPPPHTDLNAYATTLMERYGNPEIHHRLEQIAMDGSQKLPQRVLDTLFDNIAASRPHKNLLTVLAAWIRFIHRRAIDGHLNDPLAAELSKALLTAKNDTEIVAHILAIEQIFGVYPVEKIESPLLEILSDPRLALNNKTQGHNIQ